MKNVKSYKEGLIELKRMENNLLIADFMNELEDSSVDDLKYDVDWNWLIPVYSKIMCEYHLKSCEDADHGYILQINMNIVTAIYNNRIDDAFHGVVDYIKWINKHKNISLFIKFIAHTRFHSFFK